MKYRLTAAISALLDKSAGHFESVTLPAGAVLHGSAAQSTMLFGLAGVTWEGRHYSVALRDLLEKSERIKTA